jgi:glycerophosphoryl diester phosphodiesterase
VSDDASTGRVGVRSTARLAAALWLVVLVLSATVVVSYFWPVVAPTPMLIFAHHGDLRAWPEGSVEGVVAAAALGPDGVEIDVRTSADGTFWMFHGESVDSQTDGQGRLEDLSDATLRTLRFDGGPGFDPVRHKDVRLATLDQGLDAMASYTGLIMVDLKDTDAPTHGRLASHLVSRVDPSRVLVIVQSIEGARLVKSEHDAFTTLYWRIATADPAIDAWIAEAQVQVHWPETAMADFFGSTMAFVESTHDGDEAVLLGNARRWGVSLVITNDVPAALAWKAAQT